MFGFIRKIKAVRAMGRGDLPTAIRYLKEGMAAKGENAFDLFVVAWCHDHMGSDQEALDYGTRALAHDPCDLDTLQLVTRIYQDRGEDERAYLYVCRALESPSDVVVDFPRLLVAVWRVLFTFIPRVKGADPNKLIHSVNKKRHDWQAWAEDWKEGYENKYGGPPDEPIH